MSKKQYLSLVVFFVIVLGVIFIWYGLRPSIIKSRCAKQAKESLIGKAMTEINVRIYNDRYTICLREKGL